MNQLAINGVKIRGGWGSSEIRCCICIMVESIRFENGNINRYHLSLGFTKMLSEHIHII
jgi:hypothetical protein